MILKDIHVTTALISITVFVIRFYWMIIESRLLTIKSVKIIPHINDTVLLVSAIALAVKLGQYPFIDQWLTVKVIALLVYILLGTVALKRGRGKNSRIMAGFAAILTFAFILSVAGSKNPAGFISVF
ncbi:MAG: SirB2 family protein [Gammaproteobacteria bacterium]|nr:SirB2 family protein [Gammaproteobacteria bacterium]